MFNKTFKWLNNVTNDLLVPNLPESEVSSIGPVTINEASNVLKHMANKSPGTSGVIKYSGTA